MKNSDLLFAAQQVNMVKQALSVGNVAEGVGYMLPGVGTALSGRDAIKAFGQGRIMAGLGNTALAGLGLLPGGGLLGGAARGIGRGIGWAAKGLKATRAGAATARAGAGVGKAVSTAVPTFVNAGQRAGQAVVNTGKNVGAQYGKLSESFANTGVGTVLKNNPLKATGAAIGATALSKPAPAAANAADDAAQMGNLGSLAQTAQQTTPNPLFAQPQQSFMPRGVLGQA